MFRIRKLNYNRLSGTKTSWQSRPKLTKNQNWNSNSNWDAAACFSGLARIGRIGACAIFARTATWSDL